MGCAERLTKPTRNVQKQWKFCHHHLPTRREAIAPVVVGAGIRALRENTLCALAYLKRLSSSQWTSLQRLRVVVPRLPMNSMVLPSPLTLKKTCGFSFDPYEIYVQRTPKR